MVGMVTERPSCRVTGPVSGSGPGLTCLAHEDRLASSAAEACAGLDARCLDRRGEPPQSLLDLPDVPTERIAS